MNDLTKEFRLLQKFWRDHLDNHVGCFPFFLAAFYEAFPMIRDWDYDIYAAALDLLDKGNNYHLTRLIQTTPPTWKDEYNTDYITIIESRCSVLDDRPLQWTIHDFWLSAGGSDWANWSLFEEPQNMLPKNLIKIIQFNRPNTSPLTINQKPTKWRE